MCSFKLEMLLYKKEYPFIEMSCHLFILKFHLTGILSHFFCVLTEMFAFLNQNHLLQISLPYRLVFKIYSSVLMKSDCDCLKIYSICKRKTIQINRLIHVFLRKLAMVIRLYLHRLLIATQLRERQMILPGVSRSEVGVYSMKETRRNRTLCKVL